MPTTLVFRRNRSPRPHLDRLRHFREKLLEFFFPIDSDRWISILRIGLGLQIVFYCLSLSRDWNRMFAAKSEGWISRDLMETILTVQAPLVPRLGWLVNAGKHLDFSEEAILSAVWICLLGAGCCLVLGFFCRSCAIIAWFLHLCAVKSGGLLAYGMDNFLTIGLFYLMLSPLPDHASLDWRLWNPSAKDPHILGFFRRVLQLHLCVIYFFGGVAKCLGTGWWTGESMWRSLTRPPFNVLPVETVSSWHAVLPAMGIAVWLLEMSYSFFIWPKKTRLIWLVAILVMHIGIGLTLGLYLFSLIMIILNVAAFGSVLIPSPKSNLTRIGDPKPSSVSS